MKVSKSTKKAIKEITLKIIPPVKLRHLKGGAIPWVDSPNA